MFDDPRAVWFASAAAAAGEKGLMLAAACGKSYYRVYVVNGYYRVNV